VFVGINGVLIYFRASNLTQLMTLTSSDQDAKKHFVFIIIALFFLTGLSAQNSPMQNHIDELMSLDLEELLNTPIQVSSYGDESILKSNSTVSVISEEQLKAYHYSTLTEAINTVSGISVMRNYMKRNLPTSRGVLQDQYANKVLILIDGVPSWNAITGEGYLDRISIESVKRIEVLKGPASVQYGTNAFTGAINIVLKDANKNQLTTHGGVSTQAGYQSGVHANLVKGDFNLLVSGNVYQESGPQYTFKGYDQSEVEMNDYLKADNVTLEAKFNAHRVLLNSYLGEESYYGIRPSKDFGAGNPHVIKSHLFDYQFDQSFTDKYRLIAGLNVDYSKRNLSRSALDSIRSSIRGSRVGFRLNNIFSLSSHLTAELGVDYYQRHSIEYNSYHKITNIEYSTNNMSGKKVSERTAIGQISYVGDRVSGKIGLRSTYNPLYGWNLSSRASFVYMLDKHNSIKLIYGEAYREPSLFELYFNTPSQTIFGNINLKPERCNSFELVYLKGVKDLFFQLLLYHSQYLNKIHRVSGDFEYEGTKYSDVKYYDNVDDFMACGIELEFKYQNQKIMNAFLNYNYMYGNDADKIDDHYNFKYVTPHSLTIGMHKDLTDWLYTSVLSKNYSSSNGYYSRISSQSLLDINVGIKHKLKSIKLTHLFSCKNVTDTRIRIPEYAGRYMNDIPLGNFRMLEYKLRIDL